MDAFVTKKKIGREGRCDEKGRAATSYVCCAQGTYSARMGMNDRWEGRVSAVQDCEMV